MLKAPEITDALKTWDVDRIVGLALMKEDVLGEIIGALESGDEKVKIKALTVLIEVAKRSGRKRRRKILKTGLDRILDVIGSNDDRISGRGLKLLGLLLGDNNLPDSKLASVLEAVVRRSPSPNPLVWEGVIGVVENVKLPYVSPNSTRFLLSVLRSGSAEEVAVASLILVKWAGLGRDEWHLLIERIADLVNSKDVKLADAGLTAALMLTKLPPVFPMEPVVKSLLPSLRRLMFSHRDQFLKVKAVEALDGLQEIVTKYYRLHPRDAQKTAEELLRLGLVEEAHLITSVLISTLPPDSAHRRTTR